MRKAMMLAAFGFALISAARAGAADRPVLEQARDAHRASLASIETLHCRVEVVNRPNPNGVSTASEYWRRDRDFRCRSQTGSMVCDVFSQNGVTKLINSDTARQGNPAFEGTLTDLSLPIPGDAFQYGLLNFFGESRFRVTLDELLSQKHEIHSIRKETRDGRALVHLELSHNRARLDIWFDPAVNYLARYVRCRTKPPHGESDAEGEVMSFQEPAPGIYFPAKVVMTVAGAGAPATRAGWTASFSDVQVNRPLQPGSLALRFPPNLLITDQTAGRMVRANEAGEPTVPARTANGELLRFTSEPPIPLTPASESPSVTRDESRSLSHWLLPVSLALVVLGIVLWSLQRWRRGRQP